ncbi:hypothetical protein IFM89_009643 [Coptis chinensis]|uniref:Ty3 transposon capsid-like protein domain-containing protein n=1 Tax=Coptis chinensis TaxID=261450 RepID=A0A835IKZ0_9MAGN|nr:hypothetical protein IFM89_009643 [Coptis chinensis]
MDDKKEISIASLYFEGRADSWFLTYQDGKGLVDWNALVEVICDRFELVGQENYVGSFNKLIQVGTVDEYFEQFEELQALMVSKNKQFSEEYFVLSFLSGLKDELKASIQMFQPTNLSNALYLARMQEVALDAQVVTG